MLRREVQGTPSLRPEGLTRPRGKTKCLLREEEAVPEACRGVGEGRLQWERPVLRGPPVGSEAARGLRPRGAGLAGLLRTSPSPGQRVTWSGLYPAAR